MNPMMMNLVWLLGGALLGYGIFVMIGFLRKAGAQRKAETILISAREEAERIKKDASLASKEEVYKAKESFARETQESSQELKNFEKRLLKREDALDHKADTLQRRERYIENLEKNLETQNKETEARKSELNRLIEEEKKTLYNVAALNKEEATKMLLGKLEGELQVEMAGLINKVKEQTKEAAEVEAKRIITMAIQRCAANHTVESVVSAIDLPNEEMKGRIIGREGRNIRAFEKVTGIDVIVDDTPGVIVIYGFDCVRREIARRAMEKLIVDGRIHPGRIEEVVENTRKEVDEVIQETGKQVCYEVGLHNINPKLVPVLGRLKFRTSYGQNVLQHSVEVAHLTASMAAELGLDANLAKRCGLLHDIGKAVDQESEGTHPVLGADLARRFGERPEVIDAIEGHHADMKPDFIYTVLVTAADAISASRPGARRESLDKYVKRLERLESIANGYTGVEHAYAIQAGRELRVIVNASKMDDNQATITCRNIAKDIEKELKYPGEIKVTLIRETRIIEYAR
ncbi:MAG: ribonuclease Y [Planctomycetota bacterium]